MIVRTAALASIAGFLFGYDLGLIGGAMHGIKETFEITGDATVEAIVGAAKFGAFFGTFLGGALMLRYGRRRAIAAQAVFFTLGPVMMAAAGGTGALVAGRLVIGLGIGASAIAVPAYLGEIAPAGSRGAVVQVYEVMLTVGMLCSVLVDAALAAASEATGPGGGAAAKGLGASSWRWMVGLPAIPGALMAAAVIMLPESPRWLVLRGDLDGALNILHSVVAGNSGGGAGGGRGGGASVHGAPHESATQASLSAMADAEDELLLLWSAVEKDKAAVMERRRRLLAARCRGDGGGGSGGSGGVVGAAAAAVAGAVTAARAPAPARRGYCRAPTAIDREDDNGYDHGVLSSCQTVDLGGFIDGSGGGETGSGGPPLPQADPNDADAQPPPWPRPAPGGGGGGSLSEDADGVALLPLHAASSSAPVDSKCGPQGGDGGWWVESLGWKDGHRAGSLTAGAPAASTLGGPLGGARRGGPGAGIVPAPPDAREEPGRERTLAHTIWYMLADVAAVARGPERRAFALAAGLAFFDQASASTAIINYCPVILETRLGVPPARAALLPAFIALTKCAGVAAAVAAVDRVGRRPLLIGGALATAVTLGGAAAAVAGGSVGGFLASLCLFIFAFSVSWAGLYWVVVSEIFSMAVKSPASSFATSLLFLTGALVNFVFLSLVGRVGMWAFVVFAAVAAAGAAFVAARLPETAGRSLMDIQELLQEPLAGGGGSLWRREGLGGRAGAAAGGRGRGGREEGR